MEYTIGQIAQAVSGTVHFADHGTIVKGVSTDTRTLQPRELFVALKGETDGHAYVGDAKGKKAGALLVESSYPLQSYPTIAVADTLVALQELGKYHRKTFEVPVAAITGSNGKTTTKDMLAGILTQKGPVAKTPGNFNNEIGLPLTLLSIDKQHSAVVVEMGMRGLGQISHLADLAKPQVGIVTNVYPVHLELLGTIERIAQAKSELIASLPPGGTAVLNGDDPLVCAMGKPHQGPVITFGMQPSCTLWAEGYHNLDGRAAFTLHLPEASLDIILPVPGLHNVYNALAAAAGALAFEVSPEQIKEGLERFAPSGMRSHIEKMGPITVINDAYNASPASMDFALRMLKEQGTAGRRVAVLGDMLELGPISEKAHREVGKKATQVPVDLLVTVGELGALIAQGARGAGLTGSKVRHYLNGQKVAEEITTLLEPGDLVLIKASRGMELERVVDGIAERWGEGQC
ncbi:MAG: UDP-N-acetylmuramoyl-tripeptide--D-alanyl-D-alanine ligase [Limnochordia bacterium]|nr:UDP-N-acetylmuramoyl-tripeptide--D-alanyl-D-alanine ligase [Limnochordia bacterium]MDD2630599.1 UDP-N-acetylmuramoyl-tripeptide--D-alanyl-D-alanine ligase [Limnochordia bacterium]MDD4517660.1 UDP-N-acetylmuramoyl-tripeptide--D-alanyl-D-alanine ligase [Limnochordia bacterium]